VRRRKQKAASQGAFFSMGAKARGERGEDKIEDKRERKGGESE
jgi:hypothetical protein